MPRWLGAAVVTAAAGASLANGAAGVTAAAGGAGATARVESTVLGLGGGSSGQLDRDSWAGWTPPSPARGWTRCQWPVGATPTIILSPARDSARAPLGGRATLGPSGLLVRVRFVRG